MKNKHVIELESRTHVVRAVEGNIKLWKNINILGLKFAGSGAVSDMITSALSIGDRAVVSDRFLMSIEWDHYSVTLALHEYFLAVNSLKSTLINHIWDSSEGDKICMLRDKCSRAVQSIEAIFQVLIPTLPKKSIADAFPNAYAERDVKCGKCAMFKTFKDMGPEFEHVPDSVETGFCTVGEGKPVLVNKMNWCDLWKGIV